MRLEPLLLGAVVVAWVFVLRGFEYFCLSFREGQPLLVRGRVPPSLAQDLARALQGVPRARVRAVRDAGGARLHVSGVDDGTAQRLRNIFHLTPLDRLCTARAPAARNLGQWLGVEWLAWWLEARRRST
jgi:hypothetical protein